MDTAKSGESEFDFRVHRERAVGNYQKIRPLYEEFSEVTKNVLNEALKVGETKVHSIEARAKSIDSFGRKASFQSDLDPSKPKYPDPLVQITDLAGVRTITFFPKTLDDVDRAISSQFDVIEKTDKADVLFKEGKFGYQSIHYVVRFKPNRTGLPEYERFAGLVAEIQVRTLLQHAWAEIEHDIQYKSIETIPDLIRRRFTSLAGLLEIADREFQAIQNEDERITQQARKSVVEGQLEGVEITPDALKAYLDKTFSSDGRMSEFSYQFAAKTLRRMGFTNFKQIDECIKGYDGDQVNRILYGTRQGQITRFESLVEAGMGNNYLRRHPWRMYEWFVERCGRHSVALKAAGISQGSYSPPESRESMNEAT